MGFDSIILKNSMAKYGVRRPRNGKDWYFVDSLKIMRSKKIDNCQSIIRCCNLCSIFSDAMPYYESKELNDCMMFYFDECQPSPHSALDDAICVKRLCENYARIMGYKSFNALTSCNKVCFKF